MNKLLATSLTILGFFIVGLTGVFMFFHIFDGYTKTMHEILGLVFFVAVILHVFYNFKPFKRYFSNKTFYALGIIFVLVAGGFVTNAYLNPKSKTDKYKKLVFKSPIQNAAKILELKNLEQKLSTLNATKTATIEQLAKDNNKTKQEMLVFLLQD